VQGVIPVVLMRLVVHLEPDELPVELRGGRQVGGPDLQAVEPRHTTECSIG
jgi:hypothetical protein